jgi:hypothetical protein
MAQHRLSLAAFFLVAALCGSFVMDGWTPAPSGPALSASDSPSATAPSSPSIAPSFHLSRSAAPTSRQPVSESGTSTFGVPPDFGVGSPADATSPEKRKKPGPKKDDDEDTVLVKPTPDDGVWPPLVEPSPTEPSESESPSPQSDTPQGEGAAPTEAQATP